MRLIGVIFSNDALLSVSDESKGRGKMPINLLGNWLIEEVTGSKVKVSKRWPQKTCERDGSWTTERIWTKTHTNINLKSGHEMISFSMSRGRRSRSRKHFQKKYL